ncbi:Hypothetical_protein [Hexamita inflata]|uniref:Hypothetical_protein n=1 Tax=Hexamita inflata TaxID=28002 RepID=A0AA86NV42_9EUKA|nr:Hypothetical protein HINF_LOCUS13265 [Hexamita inflata]
MGSRTPVFPLSKRAQPVIYAHSVKTQQVSDEIKLGAGPAFCPFQPFQFSSFCSRYFRRREVVSVLQCCRLPLMHRFIITIRASSILSQSLIFIKVPTFEQAALWVDQYFWFKVLNFPQPLAVLGKPFEVCLSFFSCWHSFISVLRQLSFFIHFYHLLAMI